VTSGVRSTEQSATQQQPPIRSSRRLRIAILSAVVLVTVAAGIGLAVQSASKARAADVTEASAARRGSASSAALQSFGWLASSTVPATWVRLTIPSALGTLSSPPGFRTVQGDPGTLSVALLGSAGSYLGYLNVTPRQGPENLKDWATFRLTHLKGDDAVSVHEDAMVQSVRTAGAVRSCVIDDYVTTVGHHPFHEVACFVTSGSVGSVVVAATPAGDPAHVMTQLERAVAAYPFQSGHPGKPIGVGSLGTIQLPR
jgi:hypothetical protein